ncbi:MAG: type II toxin-antitoxin system VapC family toxin [Pseudomonadota bacterium]
MKYLLDTHTFLWLAADPDKLPETVAEIVIQPENELLLSAASGWECALLWKLNRIELPEAPMFFIPQVIQALSLTPLAIGFESAISAATLPLIHRDPFDRLLVATAIKEKVPIIGKDKIMTEYGVELVW